jgi:hypothetical protein
MFPQRYFTQLAHPVTVSVKLNMKSAFKLTFICFLIPCAGLIAHGQEPKCLAGGSPGWWSTDATDLCTTTKDTVPDFTRDLSISTQDHVKTVHVVKGDWWVESSGRKLHYDPQDAHVGYPAELAWSPDGNAFYITSGTGIIAGYKTELYQVKNDKLERPININLIIKEDFERRHKCTYMDKGKDIGDEPNVGALKWVSGSDQILVVAEVPPHGLCPHFGYFGGYLISVLQGKILNRYSPKQLMQGWPHVIGQKLKDDYKGLSRQEKLLVP